MYCRGLRGSRESRELTESGWLAGSRQVALLEIVEAAFFFTFFERQDSRPSFEGSLESAGGRSCSSPQKGRRGRTRFAGVRGVKWVIEW